MHVRVVRFTGADPGRVRDLMLRVEADGGGPPEGVRLHRLQVVVDEDQQTAVVIQHYESADDLSASEAVFDAMDAGDTPGERVSVDRGSVVFDRTL
jgi:hypothetical protein